MKNSLKNDKGVTLIILVITVVVMLILAGLSISLLVNENSSKSDLENRKNIINEFYITSNEILGNIQSELNIDYNTIIQNTIVSNNTPLVYDVSNWNGSVNTPNLLDDMTAIYFENGVETALTSSSPQEEWNKWYDYSSKKWANAKTSDGSYWVWIPRFAYKITNNISTTTGGNISVIFVNNSNQNFGTTYSVNYPSIVNNSMTDYVVHPAFGTNIENGGNDRNISGFWIAKYEVSMERASNGIDYLYAEGTNSLTKNAGNANSIRVVSKPNVSSWRNINVSNCYLNAYHYNRDSNSHLIKNSEWGAVTYLAQSAYGVDNATIFSNTSNTYLTGGGTVWNTTNINQSTTANAFGIYDLNGGAAEYTSSCVITTESADDKTLYATSFETVNSSNNNITIYPAQLTDGSNIINYNLLKTNYSNRIFGDAILETSTTGANNTAWGTQRTEYMNFSNSFLVRGGSYADANSGIFSFDCSKGEELVDATYRIIMY